MDNKAIDKSDKKQALLEQLKKIQTKIDNIEKQRLDKINKLIKKFKLHELDDAVIEKEFLMIKDKYLNDPESSKQNETVKKN